MSFAVASESSRICSAACDPRLGVACLLLGFVGELLRLAVRLLGGRARGVGGLVGQPPGLGQLLRRLLDELLGALLRRLGLALRVLDLVVDLGVDLLPLLLGVRLGGSARSRCTASSAAF